MNEALLVIRIPQSEIRNSFSLLLSLLSRDTARSG
jgi:hypothetical protein